MQIESLGYLSRLIVFYLLSTIAWGIFVGLCLASYIGIEQGILFGIGGGLIVSFVITSTGALYDYLLRRSIFKRYLTRSFDLIQKREVMTEGNILIIFQKSIEALKIIPTIKSVSPMLETNIITAITSTTWKSFGETIKIELFQEGDKVKIVLCSRPRLGTAIFDCGKNIENVEIISSFFRDDRDVLQ